MAPAVAAHRTSGIVEPSRKATNSHGVMALATCDQPSGRTLWPIWVRTPVVRPTTTMREIRGQVVDVIRSRCTCDSVADLTSVLRIDVGCWIDIRPPETGTRGDGPRPTGPSRSAIGDGTVLREGACPDAFDHPLQGRPPAASQRSALDSLVAAYARSTTSTSRSWAATSASTTNLGTTASSPGRPDPSYRPARAKPSISRRGPRGTSESDQGSWNASASTLGRACR